MICLKRLLSSIFYMMKRLSCCEKMRYDLAWTFSKFFELIDIDIHFEKMLLLTAACIDFCLNKPLICFVFKSFSFDLDDILFLKFHQLQWLNNFAVYFDFATILYNIFLYYLLTCAHLAHFKKADQVFKTNKTNIIWYVW